MKITIFKTNSGITKITLLLLIILVITVISLLSLIIYTATKDSNNNDDSYDNKKITLGNLNFINSNTINNTVQNPSNPINSNIIDNNSNSSNLSNTIDNTINNTIDNNNYSSGTSKTSSSFTLDGTTLTFNVPSGFTSYGSSNYSSLISETFFDSTGSISVNVSLSDSFYYSATEMIEQEAEMLSYESNFKASNVQSIKVNGKEFKYIELSYELDSTFNSEKIYVKEIYIVCDVSNDKSFIIKADTLYDDKVNLSIDMLNEFLQVSGV